MKRNFLMGAAALAGLAEIAVRLADIDPDRIYLAQLSDFMWHEVRTPEERMATARTMASSARSKPSHCGDTFAGMRSCAAPT